MRERFLVGADIVVLVDTDGAELERWPTGALYEQLLYAGVLIIYDPISWLGVCDGQRYLSPTPACHLVVRGGESPVVVTRCQPYLSPNADVSAVVTRSGGIRW
ncbi:hypothetical protein JJ691_48340 [Kutzneria sp. CA-103260]|nr:hypothetical protein JJ691_48340 [Kutzneria sp. CA-103260]